MKFADWTLPEIAKANNDLNAGYFVTGEYSKYPAYFKLKEAIEYILKQDASSTILDVGCGSGWQAEYLKREGLLSKINYTGLDISEHMCNNAKKNCPYANFIHSNIVTDMINEKYDIVYEAAVLEIISDWKSALIKMMNISNKWIILHRMFFVDDKTITEQVTTYHEIPDIRHHIGINDLNSLIFQYNFILDKKDIWHISNFNMGTFILKRI